MRGMFVLLLSILVAPLPVALGQNPSAAANSQTLFQLEQKFTNPAPLPAPVLKTLQMDPSNHELFESCPTRGSQHAIPSSWFVASEVELKRGESTGIVVKAENGCLWGANVGPFWVFRHSDTGYRLVLAASALGLELLDTRTNGYCDIRLLSATGSKVHSAIFKFAAGEYREVVREKP